MAVQYDMKMTGIWRCLTCNWYSEGKPTLIDLNDLTPMPLTSGQREEVFCPRCGVPRTSEFAPHSRGVLSAQEGAVRGTGPALGAVVGSAKETAPLPPSGVVVGAVAAGSPVVGGVVAGSPVAAGGAAYRLPTAAEIRAMPPDALQRLAKDLADARGAVEAAAAGHGLCRKCCAAKAGCIFYPCKHRVCCAACAAAEAKCPSCGAAIADRIDVD